MTFDTKRLVEWLKQPSTVKALGGVAAGLGFVYTQADLEKWTAAAVGFSILINGVYDNIPRAKDLSTEELSCLLAKMTHEQRVELMNLYKEKLKGQK